MVIEEENLYFVKIKSQNTCLVAKKLVIFASGSGSNAVKIYEHFKNRQDIKIDSLFCNKPLAGVVDEFKKRKIKVNLIKKTDFESNKVLNLLKKSQPSLIVLAGFLMKMPFNIIEKFEKKIINIHPALLPKYGGKGMYGMHIHKKVIQNKENESGLTIHYVNEEYDKGQIVFQKKVKVNLEDSPELLAKKILNQEHLYYPKIIEEILKNE